MKDYYAILGVTATADEAALKSAYRKLAKENHPDTNKNSDAEARFKEINEAYDILKDANRRAQYDAQRAGPQPGNFSWHHNPNTNYSGGFDINDILRDIQRSRGGWPDDAKNRDVVLSYAITLEEAFTGKEAEITYNLQGKAAQSISFKVPPGIQDSVKLRFQGKGDDSMTNVQPGDLYVKIQVIPHHLFLRMGYNLLTSTTIDYMDALLGTDVEIPTIEGKKIKMRIPAGINPGQSLRANGKGMPMSGQQGRGDMMVEVIFKSTPLTDQQRDLIEQARALRT